jgi:hypothetical protein
VQAAATYWNEQDLREAFFSHPAASMPGVAAGMNTPSPLVRFLCLELAPAGTSSGGQAIDLVWSSIRRMFDEAGIPAGDMMMCLIRNADEEPVRLPVEPLLVVRPDAVWRIFLHANVRWEPDGSIPAGEVWKRLRRHLFAPADGKRELGVETEVAEPTPGRAFDFCLSRLRQACSELSVAMDDGTVEGWVDSVPLKLG